MKKKIIGSILAAVVAFSGFSAIHLSGGAAQTDEPSAGSQLAQDDIRGAAILHCFNWTYNNIKANLPAIAAAGYTAVQTSPVQAPKDYSASYTNMTDQWWKLYQPLTISIANGNTWLGTKAQLTSLCAEAENYNIKVIVDIVANHMANNSEGGGYSHLNSGVESNMKNSAYYHTETYGANDNDRYAMTHGHIGMPDLNTGNTYVQQRVLNLLKECVDCGVDGFRFDAAKHIELPTDNATTRSDFWPTVINGIKAYKSDVYCYAEILNTAITPLSNYTVYVDVTDSKTGNSALTAANSGNASSLASDTYQMGAAAANSVLWAESHDTYMENSTSGISDASIYKAWAITGARAQSTSLFLARPNATMGAASSNTSWKNVVVREVNKFKNFFMGQSETLSSSGKVAYIERGTSGVSIAKLNGGGSVSLTAKSMAPGTYTDQITGNTFTVANGIITGTVGSTGVAVVYDPSAPQPPTEATSASGTEATQPSSSVVPPTPAEAVTGDADLNGTVNIKDVTAIQRYIAELCSVRYIDQTADCNDDGNITILDATLIQKYLCEMSGYGYVGDLLEINLDAEGTYTVFFTDTQNWGGPMYCYYWSDSNPSMVPWPGVQMTAVHQYSSNNTLYSVSVPSNIGYLIFDNNSKQTVNIPFSSSKLHFKNTSTTVNNKYDYHSW